MSGTGVGVRAVHPMLTLAHPIVTHVTDAGIPLVEWRMARGRLLTTARHHGADALAGGALALRGGGGTWRVKRDAAGVPEGYEAGGRRMPISLAAAADSRTVLIGDTGSVGVDIETLDRVFENTREDDDWLSADERELLAGMDSGERLLELACRWMVREACGKALGLGLLAWRIPPCITTRAGRIELVGTPGRWTIGLYCAGEFMVAAAHLAGSRRHAIRADRKEAADARGRKIECLQDL